MTEVPDYLLQRSRERRAALGLEGGDAGAAPGAESTPAVAADTAPAAAPAAAPAPVEAPLPEPVKEDSPWVKAAKERKRIPVWMAPVAIFLPIWAFMWFGTLEEPPREATGPLAEGAELYASCAGCHGTGGGGGVGPQLNNGEVVKTFPDVPSHIAWVVNGSSPSGTPYGAADREGGQRISTGNMGAFASLGGKGVVEVVLYERVAHGLIPEAELEAWVLFAEEADITDWEPGVIPSAIKAEFDTYIATHPEAAEALAEAEEAAGDE